ncbi:MAG: hypothetical protein SGPRY_006609 [Prymnesium sp.]
MGIMPLPFSPRRQRQQTPMVVWPSLAPVANKLDFYPSAFALRIESAYAEWIASGKVANGQCVLGADFFNATIEFIANGKLCQTTPAVDMGEAGRKRAGYRSVKRCKVSKVTQKLDIFTTMNRNGEWRLCEARDALRVFRECPPGDCIVEMSCITPSSTRSSAVSRVSYRPWSATDVQEPHDSRESSDVEDSVEGKDVPVVVWQWCRRDQEQDIDGSKVPEEWWCPYSESANAQIEAAYQDDLPSTMVEILGRSYEIKFGKGSMFGVQVGEEKQRSVRRDLKVSFDNAAPPIVDSSHTCDASQRSAASESGDSFLPGARSQQGEQEEDATALKHAPYPSSQDVMTVPVATANGHVFDRTAVQRWLMIHDKLPSIGVQSKTSLESHKNLQRMISKSQLFPNRAMLLSGVLLAEQEEDSTAQKHALYSSSQDAMTDSVAAETGHGFDLSAVKRWLVIHDKSPFTGVQSKESLESHKNLQRMISKSVMKTNKSSRQSESIEQHEWRD